MYESIDVYQYVTNEAMLFLQKAGATKPHDDSISDEEENYAIAQVGCVEDLLCKISDVRPELMEITPDTSLVDRLIRTATENAQKEKYKHQNSNESRERHFNKGGLSTNQRGRCGPNPNQRGRGFRGGRENFQQRMPYGDNVERRGRFSLANQRDNVDHESNADFRGKFTNQRNQNRPSNWRQRQDSSGDENPIKRGNKPNDSNGDWRKK